MAERSTWPMSAWELSASDKLEGREVKSVKASGRGPEDTVHVTYTSGDPTDHKATDELDVARLIANTPFDDVPAEEV